MSSHAVVRNNILPYTTMRERQGTCSLRITLGDIRLPYIIKIIIQSKYHIYDNDESTYISKSWDSVGL